MGALGDEAVLVGRVRDAVLVAVGRREREGALRALDAFVTAGLQLPAFLRLDAVFGLVAETRQCQLRINVR